MSVWFKINFIWRVWRLTSYWRRMTLCNMDLYTSLMDAGHNMYLKAFKHVHQKAMLHRCCNFKCSLLSWKIMELVVLEDNKLIQGLDGEILTSFFVLRQNNLKTKIFLDNAVSICIILQIYEWFCGRRAK